MNESLMALQKMVIPRHKEKMKQARVTRLFQTNRKKEKRKKYRFRLKIRKNNITEGRSY